MSAMSDYQQQVPETQYPVTQYPEPKNRAGARGRRS
jgi:hypothetical protein